MVPQVEEGRLAQIPHHLLPQCRQLRAKQRVQKQRQRAVPWQTPGVCDALGRPEPCDCCGLLLWLPRCRSVWSGNGLRQTAPNPFVQHCQDKGGELLALELPGREARRAEKREVELQRYATCFSPHPRPGLLTCTTPTPGSYAAAIFPVLAPVLQEVGLQRARARACALAQGAAGYG